MLLQDHHTMLQRCDYITENDCVKTGKFSVPAGMRQSTKQPGLAVAESSKPELRPPEKRDRRSLCGMSTVPAERLIQ